MLGHLKPCHLQSQNKEKYQNLYCSICASLRTQKGLAFSVFINNEMTLTLLALRPYLPTTPAQTSCPATAFTHKKNISKHPAIEEAARISALLGSIKVGDWATDNPHFLRTQVHKFIHKRTSLDLQKLGTDFQTILTHYSFLTISNAKNFEEVQEYSGRISEGAFRHLVRFSSMPSENIDAIAPIFRNAGKLIAVADHLIDLQKDQKANQYNPILDFSETHQTSIEEAYQHFRQKYNTLHYQIREDIQKASEMGYVQTDFVEAVQNALANLQRKIRHEQMDSFVCHPNMPINMQVQKAECGDCSCDCGGDSNCNGCDGCNSCSCCDGENGGCFDCCNIIQCCDCGSEGTDNADFSEDGAKNKKISTKKKKEEDAENSIDPTDA